MVNKRQSEDYKQLSGHVLDPMYRKFKATCAERDVSQSEGLEQAIALWLQQQNQEGVA